MSVASGGHRRDAPHARHVTLLITDHYNSYNRGDAAILAGMLEALRAVLPNASFVLATDYPEPAELTHDVRAVEWGVMRLPSRRALASWGLRSLLWTALTRVRLPGDALLRGWERELMHAYRDADLVVGCGGSYLRSGYAATPWRLWQMLLARGLGRRVMLYAATVGPFDEGTRGARWAGFVLRRLHVITLRDAESLRVLERLGVRGPLVEVTADAALGLAPPAPTPRTTGPPRVGVSVIHWHKFRQGSQEAYERAVAGMLDHLVDAWGARIDFLSTTVAPPASGLDVSGTGRDDVAVAARVRAAMRHGAAATSQDEPLPIGELQRRIADHDLWLGTRLHSTILATTALVPTVAIGYEPKTWGYFELLGVPEYVVDIETVTADALVALAERARNDADTLRAHFAERRTLLAARARRNADLAAQLLADGR